MTENFARHIAEGDQQPELRRQFDLVAASWDAKHGPDSARAAELAARVRYLRSVCGGLGRPRVLDLGCGTGEVLRQLSPVIQAGIGVDISRAMIERARRHIENDRLQFHIADAVQFCNQCQDRFELVLLVGVLDHLPDQDFAAAAVRRVIGPGGRLIIVSPHPWGPIFLLKRLAHFGREVPPANHLSPGRLIALAGQHGLRLVRVRALPYAPWPVLSLLFARLPTTGLFGPRSSLTGAALGAFATEFCLTKACRENSLITAVLSR